MTDSKGNYILSTLILFSILFILLHKWIFTKGLIISGDIELALYLKQYFRGFYPTWNFYLSNPNINDFLRLIVIIPFLLIGYLLDMPMGVFGKWIIFSFIFMSGISMYHASRVILSEIYKNDKLIFISSILSALIYMLNPWTMNRVMHYWLLVGYAVSPLIVVYFMKCLKESRLNYKYIFLVSFLLSLSSSIQYIIFNTIFLISLFIYSIFNQITKFNIYEIYKNIKSILLVLLFFILFSAYWMIPMYAILSPTPSSDSFPNSPSPTPTHNFGPEDLLSKNADILNSIRLMSYWWPLVSYSPSTPFLHDPWILVSFILPLVSFLALFLKPKNKYVLYFSIMCILYIFLVMGTKSPYPEFYKWTALLSNIPFISQFDWVFRDPDKWGGSLALTYSFLVGTTLYEVINRFSSRIFSVNNLNKYVILSFLFIILFALSYSLYTLPTASHYFNEVYNPIELPQDYYTVNNWLSAQNEDFKTAWPPNGRYRYWGQKHMLERSENYISAKPVMIQAFNSYYGSIVSNITENFGKYLSILNIKYLIYHTDVVGLKNYDSKVLKNLNFQKDFELVKNEGYLYVFENKDFAPHIFIPKQNLLVFGQIPVTLTTLNAINAYTPPNSSLISLEQRLLKYDIFKNIVNSCDVIIFNNRKGPEDLALLFVKKKYISVKRSKSTLSINLNSTKIYDIWVLSNKKGKSEIYVDELKIGEVKTEVSKKWIKVNSIPLKKGNHTITIKDLKGSGVINVFALIPQEESKKYFNKASEIVKNLRNLYIFEAESAFDYKNAKISNHYGGTASNGKVLILNAMVPKMDQSQTNTKEVNFRFSVYGTTQLAQTFTPTNSELIKIELLGGASGTPPDLSVEIQETKNGKPNGKVIASGNISSTSLPQNSWGLFTIDLNAKYLIIGKQYAIVLKVNGNGGNSSNYYIFLYRPEPNNEYKKGSMLESHNGGSS